MSFAVGCIVFAGTILPVPGDNLFDNTPSQEPVFAPSPAVEYGDEYELTVAGWRLDSLRLPYWNNNANGTVTVYIRANDFNAPGKGSPAPGTILYSGTRSLVQGSGVFESNNLASLGVTLPGRVTVTARFEVADHRAAGLMLSRQPADTGASPATFWQATGNGSFEAYSYPALNWVADFTAKIGALPIPPVSIQIGPVSRVNDTMRVNFSSEAGLTGWKLWSSPNLNSWSLVQPMDFLEPGSGGYLLSEISPGNYRYTIFRADSVWPARYFVRVGR